MTESQQTSALRAARARRKATRIGDWVLYPDLGVLRSDSGEVRLGAKSLHVLLILLDAGDQGVSRDTLLDQVWGENYPTDNVISRAMADLRAAFGEKAGEHKYIRTLPKFGYQFVAGHSEISAERKLPPSRVPGSHIQRYRHHYVLGAVALVAWLLLPKLINMSGAPGDREMILRGGRPLTSAPGLEHQPRIVPDSEWVVHAVMRRDRSDWDLFRVSLADGTQQPVAVTPGVHEHGPAVSRRADEVAYVRLSADGCDVVIQSLVLGVPEPVAACTQRFATLVDWSPAGQELAFTIDENFDPDALRRIYQVDRHGGVPRRLTSGVSPTGTDFYPRFSPSGDRLAFLRGEPQPDHRTTLWVVDVASGNEQQLTRLPAQLGGMAWIDDRRLLFSTLDAGTMQGQVVDVDTGRISAVSSDGLVHPDYSADRQLLVVAEPRSDRDMALLGSDFDARIVAQSTSDDHSGRLSPDENWIAFVSKRSGFDELWLAAVDGDAARQLTRFDGASVRYPDWHPDGSRILVSVQTDAGERIYDVDIVGGTVNEIETGFDDVTMPRWMEDGWVAGCRDENGWGICVATSSGVTQIARNYYRPHPAGIGNAYVVDAEGRFFNMSLTDGSVTKILEGMPGNGRYGWEIDEGSLYFFAGGDTGNTGMLMRVDLGGGDPETLFTGTMPVADTTISIGQQSGDILLTLFQTSSDDLVVYEDVDFQSAP